MSSRAMASQAAPLDPVALERTLMPFGESRLLPREAYVDPEVFAWEQEHFLRRRWVCVARSEELPEPGDQRAVSIGTSGVLLVRGGDGVLRAFANACRHRGHELLPCDVTARNRAIICPYHAWGYALDGTLKAAPNFREVAAFDKTEFPLLPVAAQEWHGYVFINASGDAGPLEAQLGALDEVVARYDIASLVTMARHDYVVESNWKVLSENYNECYHCPTIHPELCAVSPPDSGGDYDGKGAWVGGWMELMDGGETMSLDGRSHGDRIPTVDDSHKAVVGYVDVFPNLLISLHPDYVMTHKLTPLSATATRIECTWAFPRSSAERPGFDPAYAVDFWDITNKQDWGACESVQRGVAAPQWHPGPIAPMESTVYRLETLFAHGYLGHPLEPESSGQALHAVPVD
jgi:glycine betaine catabolism A